MAWEDIDWGDVPTWLTAVVTAVALIAAWLAVRASWHVLQLERRREDRAESAEANRRASQERADQADRVAVWIDLSDGLVIRNGSELPIYDVTTSAFNADGTFIGVSQEGVVPPGEQTLTIPVEEGGYIRLGMAERRDGRASVRFRDTAGREWERDVNGILRKTGTRGYLGVAKEESHARSIRPERGADPR